MDTFWEPKSGASANIMDEYQRKVLIKKKKWPQIY